MIASISMNLNNQSDSETELMTVSNQVNYFLNDLTKLSISDTYLNSNVTSRLFTSLTAMTVAPSNSGHTAETALSFWEAVPYPKSGYTQMTIIFLAFFVTIIMILIVVGNLLVCIAITTEKSLKAVQNWFIVSLAISDLFLGIVIMPFSLSNELMGHWIFGRLWCDIHHALDVLLCTASINNLCLISLDRYWSITQAVEYLKKRTPSRVIFMICFVWIFSALVSVPPLVGWKKDDIEPGECEVSDDTIYVLYSAFGSFYIPAIVMVFVYAKIYFAARSRARKHVKKKKLLIHTELTMDPTKDKSTTTTTCTSLSNPSPIDQNREDSGSDSLTVDDEDYEKYEKYDKLEKFEPSYYSLKQQSISASKVTFSKSNTVIPNKRTDEYKKSRCLVPMPKIVIEATTEAVPCSTSAQLENQTVACLNESYSNFQSGSNKSVKKIRISVSESSKSLNNNQNVSIQSILRQNGSVNVTNFDLEKKNRKNNSDLQSNDSNESPKLKSSASFALEPKSLLSASKPLKSFYGSMTSFTYSPDSEECKEINESEEESGQKKNKKTKVQYQNQQAKVRHAPSDSERHRRKIAKARERRATLILGLIMGAFIIAWLPFFVMYSIRGVCSHCVFRGAFTFAYWLGYCNSAINPIIYTVFNREYRKAFRKILFR